MENFQKIELRKTRDFGEKFNATFEFIRQNYKGFMPAVIFISVPLIVVGMVIISYYTYFIAMNQIGNEYDSSNPFAAFSILSNFFGLAMVAYVLIAFGYLVNTSLVYNYMRIYESRENPSSISVKELWDESKKDLGGIFIASFLVTIVAGIGMIFLIIPGIYLFITLSLIVPVMIFERKSIGDAFSRCFFLIKDKWWSTFGLIFIALIIQSVMSFIFNVPQYIITFLIGINASSSNFLVDSPAWQKILLILSGSISAIGSSLLYCISFIAIAFQYFNLVERREATGLLNQIETLGKAESINPDPKETY
jgi:hypothetical protein